MEHDACPAVIARSEATKQSSFLVVATEAGLLRFARNDGWAGSASEFEMDLIADHISHRFGALDVLDDVSFTVGAGEVVAIVVSFIADGLSPHPGSHFASLIANRPSPSRGG